MNRRAVLEQIELTILAATILSAGSAMVSKYDTITSVQTVKKVRLLCED